MGALVVSQKVPITFIQSLAITQMEGEGRERRPERHSSLPEHENLIHGCLVNVCLVLTIQPTLSENLSPLQLNEAFPWAH